MWSHSVLNLKLVYGTITFDTRPNNDTLAEEMAAMPAIVFNGTPMHLHEISVDEMSVGKLSIDEISVGKLSINEMSVDEMSVGKLSIDEMSVDAMC